MDANIVECEMEKECGCKGGCSLAILQEVQRCYEDRMALIDRIGGSNKLQMQVQVLRSWVDDLAGQNTLLVRAVHELEADATHRLLLEQRRHSELLYEARAEASALRRRLARKDSDLRGLIEVLRRLRESDYCTLEGIHFFEVTESEIFGSTEWEIRRLNKDVQHYEQAIIKLRNELSLSNSNNPNTTVCQKDAEVMAGMCCTGNECGDWEPVRECSFTHEELVTYQERMRKMEADLKASSSTVRALRTMNVSLSEEVTALRRACAALQEQVRAAALHAHFKEDIIREMRRQLNQAKTKLKEVADLRRGCILHESARAASYDSVTIACVRRQPRRAASDDNDTSPRPDSE